MRSKKNEIISLKPGDIIPIDEIVTISGNVFELKNKSGSIYHLYFGRFSGCPTCNWHYYKYSEKVLDIESRRIYPIFILHSTKKIIEENQGASLWSKTMNWVADPQKDLYKAVGAELSSSWVRKSVWKTIVNSLKGKKEAIYGLKYDKEDLMQQPMEILLDGKDGKILAIKKSKSLNDQWKPEDILQYEKRILGASQSELSTNL